MHNEKKKQQKNQQKTNKKKNKKKNNNDVPFWKVSWTSPFWNRVCSFLLEWPLFQRGAKTILKELSPLKVYHFIFFFHISGSVGSSLLAYILPCLFHMKICWHKLNPFIKTKDILIVVFGLIASLVSVVSVIQEMGKNTKVWLHFNIGAICEEYIVYRLILLSG